MHTEGKHRARSARVTNLTMRARCFPSVCMYALVLHWNATQ
jgi:hypothetical protein